ncbi:MAG TPA: patatin-like phospholipase family protein [Anaerolineales bacterium]|nr:patatin-like phospholipase family protein [Anaerolineales bacterium]
MTNRRRLGLVIGSGGLKCAAAIGVLQVLEQENIPLNMIVGCSGGAAFGASIAMGLSAEAIIKTFTQAWTRSSTGKFDIRSILKIAVPEWVAFDDKIGILDDGGLVRGLVHAYGADASFAETQIPFHAVATDLHTGEAVVLSDGILVKALRASAGIPILFKPVEWNGRWLIDGGLSNPLPVDVAIQQGADVIIAVGFETPLVQSVASPANFALQMFNILINQLLSRKFAFYNLAYHSEIIAIVPNFDREIRLKDVNEVPQIIEQGRKETLKHLTHLQRILFA